MTDAFYKLVNSHRSIRKYKNRPVPEAALERILAASVRASSSGNMQAYSVIVTQDPELKRRLYQPHFNQEMVLEAPVLLTFCADFYRMREWLKLSEAPLNFDNFMSFMIGAIDAVLAAQNAALAAEAEGLWYMLYGHHARKLPRNRGDSPLSRKRRAGGRILARVSGRESPAAGPFAA